MTRPSREDVEAARRSRYRTNAEYQTAVDEHNQLSRDIDEAQARMHQAEAEAREKAPASR